ncbi:MAG: redox-regulated ATPase YchF [Candidatus Diapherotrites archaeon]|nr:redox-regulated ATPase YchF [Candidatus Diapherotrites archaeon]
MIGIVGKPSSGKSTFFNAATELNVKTAPYPFTTIEPNVGVSWVRVECPHTEIGVECNPRSGFCIKGKRFVPVKLIDVAGLVPGAHAGRGMGNRFLDELRRAEAFIQVVDASGRTDLEGNPGEGNPVEEVEFLERELIEWIKEKVVAAWERAKKLPSDKRDEYLVNAFTGLGVHPSEAERILNKLGYPEGKEEDWAREILGSRTRVIAANKVDVEGAEDWVKELKRRFDNVVPTSALAELILRRAARSGYVDYVPGDGHFEVKRELSPEQRRALELVEDVLSRWGSTGVQEAINRAVLAKNIVVFPVADENRWTDGEGNVLPDAFILPKGSTALDLAFAIHTDIGKKFIAAVDARTKKRVGKDYELKHLDVIKIVAGR